MSQTFTKSQKHRLFAIGALGTFMATFEGSIVNVALPGMTTDLQTSIDAIAWVVMAYTVTLISLMLIFGAWVQRAGYGFGYKLGYILFTIGSIICAMSETLPLLVTGRVVQATGTAMFAAVGPAMISDVFPANERGKGIGMMVMTVALGFMIGPPVGGFLLSIWDWPSVFVVGIPIGLIGLILAIFVFRDYHHVKSSKPLPLASASTMSVALVALTFGLSSVGDRPLTDFRIWGAALIGLCFLGLFLYLESRSKNVLIGLAIFKNRNFVTSVVAQQSHFISFAGVMILMPFYLEQIRGLAPQQVGFYLVIIPICMFIVAPLSGKWSDKIGVRWPTAAGSLTVVLGLYLLSTLQPETSSNQVMLTLVVLGVGVGLFSSPNSAAFMNSVTKDQRGVTSAILATGRNIGMTIGVAFATALFDFFLSAEPGSEGYSEAFLSSYHAVAWVALGIAGVGVIVCLSRQD